MPVQALYDPRLPRRTRTVLAAMTLIMFAVLSSASCTAQEKVPVARDKNPDTADKADSCAELFPASGKSLTLETGKIRFEAPRPEQPRKGKSYLDPDTGVCIARLTDHRNEPPVNYARNYYSRFQPFNADESRVLVIDGKGDWHLYDANTFEYLMPLDLGGGSVEPHWHPRNPDVLYLLPNRGGLSMLTFDIETGKKEQIVDFTNLESIEGYPEVHDIRDIWPNAAHIWTRWEGSPSRDARYWAFLVETKDGEPLGLITFDLKTSRILGTFDIGDIGRPDHISMSPKGNYAVASWPADAADCPWLRDTGTLEKPCGLMAFDLDFENATALASKSPHSDMAITADGREVIVISNYDSGDVEMIDLETGKVTTLWHIYIDGASTSLHVSGRAYRKPGWVLISTYWTKDPDNANPWYENRLMAVELAEHPRIMNIASIITKARTYFSEPHATVNRDFTRIIFNANWGTGKDKDVDAYIALLPEGAIPEAR